jgi:hypothetical protein
VLLLLPRLCLRGALLTSLQRLLHDPNNACCVPRSNCVAFMAFSNPDLATTMIWLGSASVLPLSWCLARGLQ